MVCLIDWCYCVCPEVSCTAAKNLSVSKLTPAKLFCSVLFPYISILIKWKGTLLAGKRHKNSGFVMICPIFSSLQQSWVPKRLQYRHTYSHTWTFWFLCLYRKKTAHPLDVYCLFMEGSQLFTCFASQTLWQTPSLSFQKNIPSVVHFYPNRWSMLVLSEPSQGGGNVEEKRRSGLPMVWPGDTRKHSLCLPWETHTMEGKFAVYLRQQ